MSNQKYWPCMICGEKINVTTIKGEDILWHIEEDEIAHTKCVPDEQYDQWVDTDEMAMAADVLDL